MVYTYAQQRIEEERRQNAFDALKNLLNSEEWKDMLPGVKIELGPSSQSPGTLYLTRRGLVEERYYSHTEFDGSREHLTSTEEVKPSLELVKVYGLSVAEIQEVHKRLKE